MVNSYAGTFDYGTKVVLSGKPSGKMVNVTMKKQYTKPTSKTVEIRVNAMMATSPNAIDYAGSNREGGPTQAETKGEGGWTSSESPWDSAW